MRFLKSYLKPIARARVLFVVAGEAVHLLPAFKSALVAKKVALRLRGKGF